MLLLTYFSSTNSISLKITVNLHICLNALHNVFGVGLFMRKSIKIHYEAIFHGNTGK